MQWIHRSYDAVQWTAVGGDFSGTASATTAVDGQTVGGSGDMSVTEVRLPLSGEMLTLCSFFFWGGEEGVGRASRVRRVTL